MSRIDRLLHNYRRHLALPLGQGLPLSQRVWFLVYPPEDERRIANRIDEFEIAAKEANLFWKRIDLSQVFAEWMDTFDPEEREQCLANPEVLETYADPALRDYVCSKIRTAIEESGSPEPQKAIYALTGLMDLFDFIHVSAVVDGLDGSTFPGILLVFFPGEREGNTYRFLDARTGWNYLAVPILAEGEV